MPTARERFDGAMKTLRELEAEGYDLGPINRLHCSATGKVKAEAHKPAPASFSMKTTSKKDDA